MKKIILILILFTSINFSYSQSVEWVKVFSGNSIERVVDMAIDSDDNIIVLGYYSDSIDFDPGPDTLQPTTSDINNIFIEKLTSEGDLIWVKTIGEAGYERPESIEVDYNGNIFLSGDFEDSLDINPGSDTLMLYSSLGKFILKLDSSGNFKHVYQSFGASHPLNRIFTIKKNGNVLVGDGSYIYELDSSLQVISTQFIALYTGITLIITDDESNIIIGGYLQYPSDFDPGPDTFLLSPPNNFYRFFAKYDSLGNFMWAKTIGSNAPGTYLTDVATDQSGNIINSMYASESLCMNDNISDTSLITFSAGESAYFLKFSQSGDFIWSQILDNPNGSIGTMVIGIDQNDVQYFTGIMNCPVDFDPGPDTFMVSTSFLSAYLQVLDSQNQFLNYSEYSGSALKGISRLKFNSNNTLYSAGHFHGVCVFDSIGGISLASQNYEDGFLVKYNHLILDNSSKESQPKKLIVYPNPGTDLIQIQVTDKFVSRGKIYIQDCFGRTAWSSIITNVDLSEAYTISQLQIAKGIYNIILQTENEIYYNRYIRQ